MVLSSLWSSTVASAMFAGSKRIGIIHGAMHLSKCEAGGEGASFDRLDRAGHLAFQSALPVRGAIWRFTPYSNPAVSFNPRSP